MEDRLREHNIALHGQRLTLRPMTEGDWDILLKWNSDPEVLYYSDDRDIEAYTMEELQDIYRGVSKTPAYCFIAEYEDAPIGECWLQKMNLDRIIEKFPGQDLRRIDMEIGEKHLWGKGLGTEMIGILTKFGFESENADAIFGCHVADYNHRSRRAFEKNGYTLYQEVVEEEGAKTKLHFDLRITAEKYSSCFS